MTSGNNAEKKAARQRMAADGIPYTMALRLVREEKAKAKGQQEEVHQVG